jgi:hypothetical protein
MSYFSNLDTAIQEKKQGRGRESVYIGAIGVCLEDNGQPVKLYVVATIYSCGSLNVFPIDKEDLDYYNSRQVQAEDFWCLV